MLAHTRLAIIDTTNAAAEPMHDETDSVHIVFDGEIYNFMACAPGSRRRGTHFAIAATLKCWSTAIANGGSICSPGWSACSPLRSGTQRAGASSWRATASARSRSITPIGPMPSFSGRRSRRCSPGPACRVVRHGLDPRLSQLWLSRWLPALPSRESAASAGPPAGLRIGQAPEITRYWRMPSRTAGLHRARRRTSSTN